MKNNLIYLAIGITLGIIIMYFANDTSDYDKYKQENVLLKQQIKENDSLISIYDSINTANHSKHIERLNNLDSLEVDSLYKLFNLTF